MRVNDFNEEWLVLTQFLPKGWSSQGKRLGALIRKRNITSVNLLLRVLLIHLADGCSLRQTATRAKQGKLCNISDVALLKRLRATAEWFRWMSTELIKSQGIEITPPSWLKDYNVKSVDASVITEPGSTGTDWRLHYSMNLYALACEQFIITKPSIGESFTNFKIEKGDLWLGDRAYGRLKGMQYVNDNGGHFIARIKNKAFTLYDGNNKFNMAKTFKSLKCTQIGEWKLEAGNQAGSRLMLRICVMKKSKQQAEKAIKKAKKEALKKQNKIHPETIELCRYIILGSSLPETISAELILELYRYRWQVELSFKRLKSLIGLGHLPKTDEHSCRAWLQGKIFVALLTQAIVNKGRLFSPWGY